MKKGDKDISNKDYIAYIDTDSLFMKMEEFLLDSGVDPEKWKILPDKQKINYILELSRKIEEYVDKSCFEELQQGTYNSTVEKDDFAIVFKQEIVCKAALFIKKKKYGFHVVNDEGVDKDEIDVTGLEIIRSETPTAFKVILKKVLRFILEDKTDKEIIQFVDECKDLIKKEEPEDISSNININKLGKYIVDGEPIKGTPYHIKGAASYHKLLKLFNIDGYYESLIEGNKAKVVYVKSNPYNIDVVSYVKWPKEFTKNGIEPDYEKMIEKFLIKKIKILLEPQNRENILKRNNTFDMFFG